MNIKIDIYNSVYRSVRDHMWPSYCDSIWGDFLYDTVKPFTSYSFRSYMWENSASMFSLQTTIDNSIKEYEY